MFSGKTEELIRRLRRVQIARQDVVVFKPRIDDRYDPIEIVSHSSLRIDSIPVDSAADIQAGVANRGGMLSVIGIDEVQFFDEAVVDVAEALANRGHRVICSGLDLDYLARPFGPMPRLLAVAETVTKQMAVCMVCGEPACRSQRVNPQAGRLALGDSFDEAEAEQVLVGAADAYEARCRRCFVRGIDVPSRAPMHAR